MEVNMLVETSHIVCILQPKYFLFPWNLRLEIFMIKNVLLKICQYAIKVCMNVNNKNIWNDNSRTKSELIFFVVCNSIICSHMYNLCIFFHHFSTFCSLTFQTNALCLLMFEMSRNAICVRFKNTRAAYMKICPGPFSGMQFTYSDHSSSACVYRTWCMSSVIT